MTSDTPDAGTDVQPSDRPSALTSVANGLKAVVASTTFLLAILYYFGWIRTRALADEFGVQPDLFDFGVQDLALRAVSPMFAPIVVAALSALGARRLHDRLVVARSTTELRRLGRRLARVGAGLTVVAAVLLTEFGLNQTGLLYDDVTVGAFAASPAWLVPVLAVGGPVVYGYGLWLTDFVRPGLEDRSDGRAEHPAVTSMTLAGLVVLAILGSFAFTFLYADSVGRGLARSLVTSLDESPIVYLQSAERLSFRAPSVQERILPAPLPGTESAYRFEYGALRLMLEANDRLFLVPLDWRAAPDHAWVHVVSISDGLRVDIDNGPALVG